MKKIIALVLALMLAVTCFAACGKKDGDTKKKYTVGICNYVDDASLNQIVDNIKKQLASVAAEKGVEIEVKYDNCNGDSVVMNQIISNFIVDKVDLMVGVATPVAIAMQAAVETENSDIPVVFSAVSDPIGAKLVESLDAPGGQITGTSDYLNTNAIMDLILLKDPDIKKVGLLYCSAEANSQYQVDEVQKYLEEKGVTATQYAFSDSNDLSSVCQKAADENDAVYVPTDNTCAANTGIIDGICRPAKKPVFAGEEGICSGCGVATLSISYYDLGYTTGEMAAKVLTGEADISTMPVEYTNVTKKYNKTICDDLGMTVPEGYEAIEE